MYKSVDSNLRISIEEITEDGKYVGGTNRRNLST